MVRLLRKSWLPLAIIICAAALVPVTIGILNADKTLQLLGIGIFMVGILFALVCILLVGAASFGKKGAPKARSK
jgi:Zn-dependent membrane protease YugP